MEVDKYWRLNESFKKTLVYNLGAEAGFFSEYNNMILAILYCLKHKIRFVLYTGGANFKINDGWRDFFLPFCTEVVDREHDWFNQRQRVNESSIRYYYHKFLFKKKHNVDYLTFDLWKHFHNREFSNEIFNIPDLELHGQTQEVSRQVINLTWRYNIETAQLVRSYIDEIKLPPEYVGLHIRGGDKAREHALLDIDLYMEKVKNSSSLRHVFVLTDDYEILQSLQTRYNEFEFESFCQSSDHGYDHHEFVKLTSDVKREKLCRLFASMDVLSAAQCFIGTFSSNPGMYLGMRMGSSTVHGVDSDHWVIW